MSILSEARKLLNKVKPAVSSLQQNFSPYNIGKQEMAAVDLSKQAFQNFLNASNKPAYLASSPMLNTVAQKFNSTIQNLPKVPNIPIAPVAAYNAIREIGQPQYRQQFQQNIVPMVQPLANTFSQGIKSETGAVNYLNPFISSVNKQKRGITKPTQQDVMNIAKSRLAGFGLVTGPGQAIIGGGVVGGTINALINYVQGKPAGENASQAVGQGIEMGAVLQPLSQAVNWGIKPILNKLNFTELKSVAPYIKILNDPNVDHAIKINVLKGMARMIPSNIGVSAIEGGLPFGVLGFLKPAKTNDERIQNFKNDFVQGAIFSGGIKGVSYAGQGIKAQAEVIGNKLLDSLKNTNALNASVGLSVQAKEPVTIRNFTADDYYKWLKQKEYQRHLEAISVKNPELNKPTVPGELTTTEDQLAKLKQQQGGFALIPGQGGVTTEDIKNALYSGNLTLEEAKGYGYIPTKTDTQTMNTIKKLLPVAQEATNFTDFLDSVKQKDARSMGGNAGLQDFYNKATKIVGNKLPTQQEINFNTPAYGQPGAGQGAITPLEQASQLAGQAKTYKEFTTLLKQNGLQNMIGDPKGTTGSNTLQEFWGNASGVIQAGRQFPVEGASTPLFKEAMQGQVDNLARQISAGEITPEELFKQVDSKKLNPDVLQRAMEKSKGLELLTKFVQAKESGKIPLALEYGKQIMSANPSDPISQYKATIQPDLEQMAGGQISFGLSIKASPGKSKVQDLSKENPQISAENPLLSPTSGETTTQEAGLTDIRTAVSSGKITQAEAGVLRNPDLYVKSPNQTGFVNEMEAYNKKLDQGIPTNQTPPTLETNQQAQDIATLEAMSSPTGSLDSNTSKAVHKWIGDRQATNVEGVLKRKEFSNLDSEGFSAIDKIQSGDKKYAPIRNFFDAKFNEVKNSGIPINYKENYLPQLWDNTPEEVTQAFKGRTLGGKPSFTMDTVFDTYKQGIAAGLTPKYSTVGELAGWYEKAANKSLADQSFFKTLVGDNMIQPVSRAPSDWVPLNPRAFPIRKVTTPEGTFTGTYKAPPELAKYINNYLSAPNSDAEKTLAKIASVNSTLKNLYLSSGVPKTAVNFHGFNQLAAKTLSDPNPIHGFLQGVYWMINPEAAQKSIDANLASAPFAVKAGLTMSTEDFNFLQPQSNKKGALGAVLKFQSKYFEDPLFQKMIPATKLQYFNQTFDKLSQSMPQDEAAKSAAEITNNFFGGLNIAQMGRDPNLQNGFRSSVLAADWLESRIRTGVGIAKSLTPGEWKNPASGPYRIFARNLGLAMLGANILNKITSGHLMFQNDPGHTTEIQAGYTKDGQKRYVRFLGTTADFVRIPIDVAVGLAKGDTTAVTRVLKNRLSPVLSQAIGQLFNVNWLGQKIVQPGTGLGEQLKARGSELAGVVLPQYLAAPLQYAAKANNMNNWENVVTAGLELPIRYFGGAYTKTQKGVANIAQQGGVTGQPLYNLNQATRGLSFGKSEMGQMQKGVGAVKTIVGQKVAKNAARDTMVQQIADSINRGKTREEKIKLWTYYWNKGVIKQDIVKDLQKLVKL